MSEPILRLEGLNKRFGNTVAADGVTLDILPGEFFSFLGPSGSGKSTILRMIAGLEQPDSGRVLIEGRDVSGVPPWHRNLGMVFQHYAVFPHMNVAQNVGYGLRVRQASKAVIDEKVHALLRLVGLAGKEGRSVVNLSGGEQQRVALARALAREPAILLLDEPLSALDEKIRRDMQNELKSIQHQTHTTFLYVTHDQEEALTMSDRIAVIDDGRCVQCDRPETLFRRPRTRFVAGFFRGCNVLEAECAGEADGQARLRLGAIEFTIPTDGVGCIDRARVAVAIRAESPHLGAAARERDVTFSAIVTDVIYRGTVIDHVLELADGQQIVVSATRRQAERKGEPIKIGVDPEDVVLLED